MTDKNAHPSPGPAPENRPQAGAGQPGDASKPDKPRTSGRRAAQPKPETTGENEIVKRRVVDAQGRTSIEDPVYFEIAYREARSVPGVVDVKGTFFEMLTGHAKGVHVKASDTAVILELRLALEYGRFIPDVVVEVRKRIANAIRRMTDREVRSIKVTIDRLVEGYDHTEPLRLEHDEESEHIDF